jgi:formylglycine-generating enzyme required for sulfatase activity
MLCCLTLLAYGLLDMARNVQELTRSLWGKDLWKPDFKYPYQPDDGWGDLNADDEIVRVSRSGSWGNSGSSARCAYRGLGGPNSRYHFIGFRVAVSPI